MPPTTKKPVKSQFKLTLPAGGATPAPPVGPVLGQHGVMIPQFVQQFNDATAEFKGSGLKIPCVCYVFEDRTFELEFKTPPASDLIKKELNLKGGSGKPNTEFVGELSDAQLAKIAEIKKPDLNANDEEAAKKIIAGSARQMGVKTSYFPS